MMVVTIHTYQAVHWYMNLLSDFENITEVAALVRICMVPWQVALVFGCTKKPRLTEAQTERQNELVLIFILVVYIDGLAHNTGGTAAFRDITRCKYFAKEIETTGQTWAIERLYKYNQKIGAYCVPKFLPKENKFWD